MIRLAQVDVELIRHGAERPRQSGAQATRNHPTLRATFTGMYRNRSVSHPNASINSIVDRLGIASAQSPLAPGL